MNSSLFRGNYDFIRFCNNVLYLFGYSKCTVKVQHRNQMKYGILNSKFIQKYIYLHVIFNDNEILLVQ